MVPRLVLALSLLNAGLGAQGEAHTLVRPGDTIPVDGLSLSGGECEPAWLPTFGHYESMGILHSLVTWDDGSGPAVYGGGSNAVYRLRGNRWEPLPGSFFCPDFGIVSLAEFDDGHGSKLYIGGDFIALDGRPARGLARWDGKAWELLNPNLGTAWMTILSMEVYDDGLGGGPALYFAGQIPITVLGVPARNMLRYDGAWSLVGSPPPGLRIDDLEVFDDGRGGGAELYASGTFDVGGARMPDLARWNGTRWELLSAGYRILGEPLYAPWLQTFDDGLGGGPRLCVVGQFNQVGGVRALRVASWDGVAWAPLGPGVDIIPTDVAAFDNGTGPGLYVAGTEGRLRRWDGTSWSIQPRPPLSRTNAHLEVVDDGGGRTLYVGNPLVRWEEDHWRFFWDGLSAPVRALAVHDDGLGGGAALYAGGDLFAAGGRAASGIAKWDGTRWEALGLGVNGPMGVQSVLALASFDETPSFGARAAPVLFVAGEFDHAGGESALNIARWDGTSWSAVGPGLNDAVHALIVFDDGLGGGPALYAGGDFTASGATPLAHVARWDGLAWSPLGTGADATVLAFEIHDDGLGGGPALYAGGSFAMAGGLAASEVARWDGVSWTPLGSGIGGYVGSRVQSLLSFDDGNGPTLWAGGFFTLAGGSPADGIARWDGFAWSVVPGDLSSGLYDLASFDDGTGGGPDLFVAGFFTSIDGRPMRGSARWDGVRWSAIGGRGASYVWLAADSEFGQGPLASTPPASSGRALYLGGTFRDLEGDSDSYLARFQGCAPAPPGGTEAAGDSPVPAHAETRRR